MKLKENKWSAPIWTTKITGGPVDHFQAIRGKSGPLVHIENKWSKPVRTIFTEHYQRLRRFGPLVHGFRVMPRLKKNVLTRWQLAVAYGSGRSNRGGRVFNCLLWGSTTSTGRRFLT